MNDHERLQVARAAGWQGTFEMLRAIGRNAYQPKSAAAINAANVALDAVKAADATFANGLCGNPNRAAGVIGRG